VALIGSRAHLKRKITVGLAAQSLATFFKFYFLCQGDVGKRTSKEHDTRYGPLEAKTARTRHGYFIQWVEGEIATDWFRGRALGDAFRWRGNRTRNGPVEPRWGKERTETRACGGGSDGIHRDLCGTRNFICRLAKFVMS